jgi:hypothetical protein
MTMSKGYRSSTSEAPPPTAWLVPRRATFARSTMRLSRDKAR